MGSGNVIMPPSGGLIGIAGTEDKLTSLRVAADGTLSNTQSELSPLLLDVASCQAIDLWIQLTIGSLTSWSIFPVLLNADGSTEFRPFSWAYNATSDWWVANAPVEFNMPVSGNFLINIPTFGASFMKFRHESLGTVTSSSAIIDVSRNWNLHKYYIQDPA